VLSVTKIEGGQSHNVLPAVVRVTGTVRSFEPEVQDTIEAALRDVVAGVAIAYGVTPAVVYDRYYPATINQPEAAAAALAAAKCACCHADTAPAPAFTSEDFAFMLQARKGAYIWLGQAREGEHVPLHHPRYDFNDAVIPAGIRLHAAIAERLLAA
jgi:hippurate hydrolase